MKNKPNILDFFGYALLAIFLFSTHTKLFYWLDPVLDDMGMINFSWQAINEKTIQAMIYGALFGLMTVFIIIKRRGSPLYGIFIIIVAILDGLVVLWLYEIDFAPKYRMLFATSHYTLYTMFIILMFGFRGKENAIQYKEEELKSIKVSKGDSKEYKDLMHGTSRNKDMEEEVMDLINEGIMSQADIARKLNIPPYKVTRIKQKCS